MTADDAYQWLIDGRDVFETHVLASILALAISETSPELGVGDAAGYAGLPSLLALEFPHAVDQLTSNEALIRGEDEACVHDLLQRGATAGSPFELLLAGMIARRAQRPNHLWQDLGLRNRGELSKVMAKHFAPLARRNANDMKWKKFFFRVICRDADYTICTAPSCGECCDFDTCFSAEDGESFLAHLRRSVDAAAAE